MAVWVSSRGKVDELGRVAWVKLVVLEYYAQLIVLRLLPQALKLIVWATRP